MGVGVNPGTLLRVTGWVFGLGKPWAGLELELQVRDVWLGFGVGVQGLGGESGNPALVTGSQLCVRVRSQRPSVGPQVGASETSQSKVSQLRSSHRHARVSYKVSIEAPQNNESLLAVNTPD